MKIFMSLLAALSLVTPALEAKTARLRVDAGQTIFMLGEFQNEVETLQKDAVGAGGSAGPYTKNHAAPFIELGVDFYLNDRLSLGPEIGYMLGTDSNYVFTEVAGTVTTRTEGKYTPQLIPLLLRLSWDALNPDMGWYYGFDFGLGIGIGYVTPGGHVRTIDTSGPSDTSVSVNGEIHSGVAPLVKAGLHGGYRFGVFALGGGLGYRYVSFSQLQDPNNRPLKTTKGASLAVDLGGLEYNVEFAFNF